MNCFHLDPTLCVPQLKNDHPPCHQCPVLITLYNVKIKVSLHRRPAVAIYFFVFASQCQNAAMIATHIVYIRVGVFIGLNEEVGHTKLSLCTYSKTKRRETQTACTVYRYMSFFKYLPSIHLPASFLFFPSLWEPTEFKCVFQTIMAVFLLYVASWAWLSGRQLTVTLTALHSDCKWQMVHGSMGRPRAIFTSTFSCFRFTPIWSVSHGTVHHVPLACATFSLTNEWNAWPDSQSLNTAPVVANHYLLVVCSI